MNDKLPGSALVTPILILNVDCFEELFEWLSVADLLALRRTCKRLQKVVDHFIKSYYPAVKIIRCGKYVKPITVTLNDIPKNMIRNFQMVLPVIEELCFMNGFKGDFYDLISKWCFNLKFLSIQRIKSNILVGNSNQWLCHKYPSLERIDLRIFSFTQVDVDVYRIKELKLFFELNPNIKIFSTDYEFLCTFGTTFLETNIKIDRLDINMDIKNETASILCNLLKKLYSQGFYTRVHLYGYLSDRVLNQISSVRGLEKLYTFKCFLNPTLSPIPHLKELAMYDDVHPRSSELMVDLAINLISLERVYFIEAKINAIMPFLRYSPRLKGIKIDQFCQVVGIDNDIIDLTALNRERCKLDDATKVTIYVNEEVFLKTKFAIKNTKLSLITLKRHEAVEWRNVFCNIY